MKTDEKMIGTKSWIKCVSKINMWLPEQTGYRGFFSPLNNFLSLDSKNPAWCSKACLPQGQGHAASPCSVLLGGELGSFVVNFSVGSHGAAVQSVAPHRDLQSLRQFLGCQLGLQLLKIKHNTEEKLTWKGRNNYIIIEQNCSCG